MNIRALFLLIGSCALLIVLVMGVSMDVVTTRMREDMQLNAKAGQQTMLSERIARTLGRAARFDAVWTFSKNDRFLKSRNQLRSEIPSIYQQLYAGEKNPSDRALLLKMHQAIETLFSAEDQILVRVGSERPEIVLGDLSDLNDRAYAIVDSYVDAKSAEFASMKTRIATYERFSTWMTRSAEAASVILFLVMAWLLNIALLNPVRHLLATIIDYRSGKWEVRIDTRGMGLSEARSAAMAFNDLADWLSAIDRRRTQYLAGVAHDIRNPLTAMKTAISLVRGELPREKKEELFSLVSVQIDRIEQLLSEWIDARKVEQGVLELHLEPVDLRKLAEESVKLWRPVAGAHSIRILAPARPLVVRCDPSRIDQVLNNLLSNAIKFSPAGGGIEVRLAGDSGSAELRVRDSGVGIAPEELGRVFEPFRRSGATRDRIAGIGLGLFNCKKIIEAHGGEIGIQSRLGEGTTLSFRLPLAASAARAA